MLFLLIAGYFAFALDNQKEITDGLKFGNAKKMSTYFDNSVDITFSQHTSTYSKRQAEIILQKFFSKVEPNGFYNQRSGISHYNKSLFIIGNLTTSGGEYKVYMLLIEKSGEYFLREIRFEK
mgnify:CR=1 FL=1